MATVPHIDREQSESANRVLLRLLQRLHSECDRFAESRVQMRSLQDQKNQDRELHPEYANASHRSRMAYLTVLFGVPAVLFLDIVLLNSTAEYLASGLFPDQPWMLLFARLAVPFLLFFIECLLAQHVYEALQKRDGICPQAVAWAGCGIVVAACVAAAVLFSMGALQTADDSQSSSIDPLGWGLCVLAFLIHSSIVFAGGALNSAKGYWCFRFQDASISRQRRRFEGTHIRTRREIASTFLAYVRQLNLSSSNLNGDAKAGPFSKAVRAAVNEVFGSGTIPDSGANDAAAPTREIDPLQATAPSETKTNDPDLRANSVPGEQATENDYMRQILERVRLEQDEEVRA
jgi:hypothetical protein